MKKQTILIAIFTLFSLISFGQKKMIEKAKKAFEYYENGEKLKAVKIFEELIVEYPNSEQYGRNLYNIPTIYQELNDNELAIKWFLKVLDDKSVNDSEIDNSRGIFETNTNFKHYASTNIGVLNYNIGNYSEALKYYLLADLKYKYYNTSGTDIKLNKIKLALNISDCYQKLNMINNAIAVLLPHALTESPQFNNQAADKLSNLLKEKNKESEFKLELEKSFNTLEKIGNGIRLNVYNIPIFIKPYSNEELNVNYLKEKEFYKKLN